MVDQGPQRPDALLEMGFRFRRFARDRICVLQRLAQFRVAEKCVAVGAKSFLIGNPNWEHARRGRCWTRLASSRLTHDGLVRRPNLSIRSGFSARARKTAPAAGALPDSTTHFGFKRAPAPLYLSLQCADRTAPRAVPTCQTADVRHRRNKRMASLSGARPVSCGRDCEECNPPSRGGFRRVAGGARRSRAAIRCRVPCRPFLPLADD